MKVEEFFELTPEEQERIVKLWQSRKAIVSWRKSAEKDIAEATEALKKVQDDCTHPMPNEKYVRDEDEYGRSLDSGTTWYDCPDCAKRWFIEHDG